MTRTFFPGNAALMSPRTAKYVEAMVREDFDYYEWLEEVRKQEAQAKRAEATRTSLVVVALSKPMSTPDGQHPWPNPPPAMMTKRKWLSKTLLPYRQAKRQAPKARLTRWLEKVRRASDEFQRCRRRDGVYIFLERVFEIVMHYKVRRRTNQLLRRTFKFAGLSFDPHVDPFAAIIRCTTGGDVDNKTISKYARALRYAARRKEPDTRLKRFMKKIGGVNACASLYAKQLGRNSRVAAI